MKQKINYKGVVRIPSPPNGKALRKLRLEYAKKYVNYSLDFWKDTIFMDEVPFYTKDRV